jgi:hypothetical protein
MGRLVGRGALAGLVAGLLAACYGFVFVEPHLQRAIDVESARAAAAGETPAELLSRGAQHVGLVVGLAVVGLTIGVLYGVVMALLHRARGPVGTWDPPVVWREAVRLAAVGFAAMHVLAFVRYPANPPGIGGPDTINTRTDAWLLAVLVGLFAAALAWRVAALLVERGVTQPLPALAVAAILGLALGVLFLALPARPDPAGYPAGLLWNFRIASFGSYVVLWGGLAAAFTLLTSRERSRARARKIMYEAAGPS